MKHAAWTSTALLLLLMSPPLSANGTDESTLLIDENYLSSLDELHADPFDAYETFKEILREEIGGVTWYPAYDPMIIEGMPEEELVTLNPCGDDPIAPISPDVDYGLSDRLMELAYTVEFLKEGLSENGYPEELWSNFVEMWEEISRNAIIYHNILPELDPLADAINREVQSRGLALPPVAAPACGGEIWRIKVVTEPPGGSVRLIPLLYHRFCAIRGYDPQDRNQCEYWRPAVRDGDNAFLRGRYFFQVRWPDGTVVSDDKDVDESGDEVRFP